jgi:hypothetical protein
MPSTSSMDGEPYSGGALNGRYSPDMHFRRERVRIETQRHEIEGTLLLPHEGFRSRTTDFLNAHEREFLALTDAEIHWLDGSRRAEQHEFLAVAVRQVVLVLELETLGMVDDSGPAPLSAVSTPPPFLGEAPEAPHGTGQRAAEQQ